MEQSSFSKLSVTSPTSQLILILQAFCHFTYVTTHSPTLPSLSLRLSSFSNPSVSSPTSQFILQPFFRFSYVTSSSLNSPGEPPMSNSNSNTNNNTNNNNNTNSNINNNDTEGGIIMNFINILRKLLTLLEKEELLFTDICKDSQEEFLNILEN